ncbi:glycine cleavage system protein GcvH [Salinibacterium sp. M195]|uniref:glycine cleavage system protein GcvH n=1 Tax=Salinibacterium sp. M195 TaxID=2583374 RepID=UPI001C62493A|nr:glycine cleavage system protein GcvH [Salinibacterium sp. M195]QYH36791.1 glycine cleavage system protein GcvH [Salinibacterium sp. M195]
MAEKSELQYTAEHEWVLVDGNVATIGITDFAAGKLGDIVFVDLPKVGSSVAEGKIVGEIESTKSVGEIFAPVSGTVVEANDAVSNSPEIVNSDPFGEGWLVKIEFSELPSMLSLDEYTALTAE